MNDHKSGCGGGGTAGGINVRTATKHVQNVTQRKKRYDWRVIMQLGSGREAAKDVQSYHRKAIATWSRRQLRTELRTQGLHHTMHDKMQMIDELVRVLTCDYYTTSDSVGYGWESFHVTKTETECYCQ